MNSNAYLRVAIILILATALAACQAKFITGQGNFVPEEKRIDLPQEGSESGSWQGKNDLMVNYTATRNQDMLQMAGDIKFRRHKKLISFDFSAVLIDGDGTVLEVVPVTGAGGRRKIEQISFSRELSLPPDTRFFTFTYSGSSGGGGDSGSPNSFWSTPW